MEEKRELIVTETNKRCPKCKIGYLEFIVKIPFIDKYMHVCDRGECASMSFLNKKYPKITK